MKAVVFRQNGPADVLSYEDVPDPRVGPGDVLVKVEVVTIEGGDLLNRAMIPPAAVPQVIGYQAGGIVIAVGSEVQHIRPGQRVAAFGFSGSYAEQFCVPAHHAFVIPDGLDIRVGATIPVTFGTADDALFEFGHLKAGETVLIVGGAGGVGLAAIQLARAAGARVLATARGKDRAQRLEKYGAHTGIAYDEVDYADEVLRHTDNRGADLVVDMAGGPPAAIARLFRSVAYRGRIAIVGAASGELPSIGFWDIIVKNLTVHGILFGAEMHTPRAHALLDRHFAAAAAGRLTMPIDREFALADAVAAHRYVETNRPFGRVLLRP
jgi:NADPH:quinone reductase-like Zn-dependent oxidoreductase